MAYWEEGQHTAVVDIGLGAVVLRMPAVGKDILAVADLGYGEELQMAGAEVGVSLLLSVWAV